MEALKTISLFVFACVFTGFGLSAFAAGLVSAEVLQSGLCIILGSACALAGVFLISVSIINSLYPTEWPEESEND